MEDFDKIIALANEASLLTKHNRTYIKYIAAKRKLQQDPELYQRVKSFKEKERNYREQCLNGNDNFDAEKGLYQEYYKLMIEPKAKTFLTYEKKLMEGLSKVYSIIFDNAYMDLLL